VPRYEFGFFEFDIRFGKEYPIKSPSVKAITTNSQRTRFNPNIYNEGKVCLSILGTWRGNPGEEWSSAQGLESVLLSIQSLMSHNPYENEPGYETAKKEEPNPTAYVAKIRHETLRIAVIQRLEGLLGIKDERGQPASKRPRTDGIFSSALSNGNESQSPSANGGKAPSTEEGTGTSGVSTPATEPSVYEYDAEATFNALDQAQWVSAHRPRNVRRTRD
jgi:ubiquitin-conjugating enzyme E2 Z